MGASNRSAPARHVEQPVSLEPDLRRRPRPDGTALLFEEGARRLGVHRVERPVRNADRRRLRVGSKHLGEHAGKSGRGGVRRLLVEGGQRQRIPQHLPQPRRLAVADQPVLDGLSGRCGNRVRPGLKRPPRDPNRRPHPQNRQPILPRERRPVEDAGNQVERRWQAGEIEPAAHAVPVHHRHASADWNDTLSRAPMCSRKVSVSR